MTDLNATKIVYDILKAHSWAEQTAKLQENPIELRNFVADLLKYNPDMFKGEGTPMLLYVNWQHLYMMLKNPVQYYSPKEVARMLSVCRVTVYNWLKSGMLKGIKAGTMWRITQEAIDDMMKDSGKSSDAHTV